MAFDMATILLGAGFAGALVLIAKQMGYLGRRKTNGGSPVALSRNSSAPATEQVRAEASAASGPAPSPGPARYETVQPGASVAPLQSSGSSGSGLGASTTIVRPAARTYRRRTAPTRSKSLRTEPAQPAEPSQQDNS